MCYQKVVLQLALDVIVALFCRAFGTHIACDFSPPFPFAVVFSPLLLHLGGAEAVSEEAPAEFS